MNNEEDKLQSEVVIWFSNEWPELSGHLFEINNDTYSAQHAMKRRAMGMVPGAADLGLISPHNGLLSAIEVKAPGTTHKTSHLKQQLRWGQLVMKNGNYCMTHEIGIMKQFITSIVLDNSKFNHVPILDLKKKTHKF